MWIIKEKDKELYFSRLDKELYFILGTGIVLTDSIKLAMRFKTKADAIYYSKYARRWSENSYKFEVVKEN